MFRISVGRRASGLALAICGLAGCIDPDQKFDDFAKRKQAMAAIEADAAAGGGSDGGVVNCDTPADLPDPSALNGEFLFVVSTTIATDKPFVYLMEVKAAKTGDDFTLMLRQRPLSKDDRKTPVGPFTPFQTSTVKASGCFTTPDDTYEIPAAANPIINADATSELVFAGNVSTAKIVNDQVLFFCGTVTGMSVTPLSMSVDGSTFAAARITDPNHYPDVVIDCAMTPAGPLP